MFKNQTKSPDDSILRIMINDVSTTSKVGIWEHEKILQPILINLEIEVNSKTFPRDIEDCMDYDPICNWLTNEFPKLPHTKFLEVRILEIFNFVFKFDEKVKLVNISIVKTNAFPNIYSVGINRVMSKAKFIKMDIRKKLSEMSCELLTA